MSSGREQRSGEFSERVVKVRRCAAVVKGGRRFSFAGLVVVGNGQGKVGWGYGKANEVPPAVEKAIKDGMLKLMSEQRLAERLSSAARCRVEQHFSWKRAQAELLAVYESLLEDSNSRCSSGASLAASVSS